MGLFEDLKASQLFTGFSLPEIKQIVHSPRHLMLRENEYLFREDEPADSIYVVVSGKLVLEMLSHMRSKSFQGAVELNYIGANQAVGFWSFYPPYRFTHSARVAEGTSCIVIGVKDLMERMSEDSKLGYRLMLRISEILLGRLDQAREEFGYEKLTRP